MYGCMTVCTAVYTAVCRHSATSVWQMELINCLAMRPIGNRTPERKWNAFKHVMSCIHLQAAILPGFLIPSEQADVYERFFHLHLVKRWNQFIYKYTKSNPDIKKPYVNDLFSKFRKPSRLNLFITLLWQIILSVRVAYRTVYLVPHRYYCTSRSEVASSPGISTSWRVTSSSPCYVAGSRSRTNLISTTFTGRRLAVTPAGSTQTNTGLSAWISVLSYLRPCAGRATVYRYWKLSLDSEKSFEI